MLHHGLFTALLPRAGQPQHPRARRGPLPAPLPLPRPPRPSPMRLQHSGTFTPRDYSNGSFPNDDNKSNSIVGVFPSPYTYDPEESDSSLAQWPRRDNAAPSPFVSNEKRKFSTATSNEESNSLPEVIVRGEGSERGEDTDEPPAKIRKVTNCATIVACLTGITTRNGGSSEEN
ncbi:uncharacterized protein LOC134754442 [Cydia strobilella]|uniref:uncharacterized protein LOC134754442 n=1 Tax=Cydia strobilella TaxID=1100964 RepID=UPI0030051241